MAEIKLDMIFHVIHKRELTPWSHCGGDTQLKDFTAYFSLI